MGHDLAQLTDFYHNQLDHLVNSPSLLLPLSDATAPGTLYESSTATTTTLLSTSAVSDASSFAYLQPAHEHAQPLWGPPDPYLSAGKSIAPLSSPAAGATTPALDAAGTAASSASTAATTATTTSPELEQQARLAAARGWNVLDAHNARMASKLPGFAETGGILPRHVPGLPLEETPATFAAQVEWSASFLKVVDKLPYAAILYALVEFLVLRPNVDLYKEEVEDDPVRALADTVKVTTVRMGAFAFVAIVTLILFGG